jgi:hypothetical protein
MSLRYQMNLKYLNYPSYLMNLLLLLLLLS